MAPSIRTHTRFELFRVRDELRMMRIKLGDDMPLWTFNHMQHFINAAIYKMHRIDLLVLRDAEKEIKSNPALAKVINNHAEKLEREIKESGIRELYELRSTVYRVIGLAFVANCGGWIIYVLPIVIAFGVLDKIKNTIKEFLYLPVGALDKISGGSVAYR